MKINGRGEKFIIKNFFWLALCVLLVIVFQGFEEVNSVEAVAVNELNGNIAFAYFDSNSPDNKKIVVECYTPNGERLFKKHLPNDEAAVNMTYSNDILYIYIPYDKALYLKNDNGDDIEKNEGNSIDVTLLSNFGGFKGINPKTYEKNEIKYCYEEAAWFQKFLRKGYARLFIVQPNGEKITVYEHRA